MILTSFYSCKTSEYYEIYLLMVNEIQFFIYCGKKMVKKQPNTQKKEQTTEKIMGMKKPNKKKKKQKVKKITNKENRTNNQEEPAQPQMNQWARVIVNQENQHAEPENKQSTQKVCQPPLDITIIIPPDAVNPNDPVFLRQREVINIESCNCKQVQVADLRQQMNKKLQAIYQRLHDYQGGHKNQQEILLNHQGRITSLESNRLDRPQNQGQEIDKYLAPQLRSDSKQAKSVVTFQALQKFYKQKEMQRQKKERILALERQKKERQLALARQKKERQQAIQKQKKENQIKELKQIIAQLKNQGEQLKQYKKKCENLQNRVDQLERKDRFS